MKTELMLLIQTDGRPVLDIKHLASLLNLSERGVQNRIYAKSLPFATFKLADTGEWVAHVSDVAAHIDEQREEAQRVLAA